MEYSVRVWSAMQGDVVPLVYVAHAMARRAATGYGTLPIHGPTLKNLRPERTLLLLDAARNGQLTVCDSQGRVASVKELVETAKALADELAGAVPVEAMNAEAIILFLHARRQHLIEWGKANGDVFLFVETPGTVVDSDLRNFTEAGFGEIIEEGYYRNSVGGGESEPWHDNLHGTALATVTATPAPVVTVGAPSGVVEPDYSVLATPAALLDAFEKWGMKAAWFDELDSHKWLLDARRKKGQGQRGSVIPPMFCPYAVMCGLVGKVRKATRLNPDTAWRTLEHKFPKVYAAFESHDTRDRTGD